MPDASIVEISETEILYKGVRFIADPNVPNRMSVYLMCDDHSTLQAYGQTVEDIVRHAKELVKEHSDANSGVIFLMFNKKEISRRYFYVNAEGFKLNLRDRSLEEMLTMDDMKELIVTNPKS